GAVLFEELREPAVRLLFFKGQLGRVVDAMRESLEIVGEPVDGLGDRWLDRVGAAHARSRRGAVAASNSRRASATTAGFASRSHVVMAMIFAEASMPSRASGRTADANSGMMFAAAPPLVTMPWMRDSGRICCRSMLTLLNVWITASRALTPSHGSAEACAALPVNSKPARTIPRRS